MCIRDSYIRILFNSKSGKGSTLSMPKPMLNIFNGGAHSNNRIDIQEFMIMPSDDVSFSEGLKNCVQVYTSLKRLLSSKGWSTNVGDEGGFAPNLDSNEEVIEYLIKAIQSANFSYGKDIFISLDCAASEFFDGKNYILNATDETFSSDGLVDYYVKLIKKFDIKSIEDPLHEDDWDGWIKLTRELNGVQIVGDDIFVTQRELLKKGIDSHAGNAILIKPNQVGTLTESLESIQLAKENEFNTIISHRSGETEDSFIADLAVGVDAKQIKTGAPSRSDRNSKYNRLLIIENELYPKK